MPGNSSKFSCRSEFNNVNYITLIQSYITRTLSQGISLQHLKINLAIIKTFYMKLNVIGYWAEKKEKLKVKFPDITESDLIYNEGKEKEMIEMLGYKLGKSQQELLTIIVAL